MTTTVGKYGKRVIGEAAVQREKEVVRKAATKYGPRVIGNVRSTTPTQQDPDPGETAGQRRDAEAAALKQENEALATRLAELEAKLESAVTAESDQVQPEEVQPEDDEAPDTAKEEAGEAIDFAKAARKAAGADGYLNVAELTAAVQANPALVDGFFAREIEREPRPRVSALRALLAAETGEGGQRRPDVAARIEEAIAGVGAE